MKDVRPKHSVEEIPRPPSEGHQGSRRTIARLAGQYYWPRMRRMFEI